MPMNICYFSCPYKFGTKEYKEWCRIQELKVKDQFKAKKTFIVAKLNKYNEICKQWNNGLIDWNTYCRLSKKYYQSPNTLAAYGCKS